jgi:hypothetical protein
MAAQLIMVRAAWNSREGVRVQLDALEDLHWRRPEGSRRSYIYASVWCSGELSGDLGHSCSRIEGPHRLDVCVTRRGNGLVYDELAARSGPRPTG